MSRLQLLARAVAVYVFTVLLLSVLLFLSAGTLHYPGAQRLMEGLPGYADYTQRVRWRLIPFIW